MNIIFRRSASIALMLFFVLGAYSLVSAQGRGRGGGVGNGGGRGVGPGGNPNVGRPSGIGVDRGLGNASEKSKGKSDAGLANASVKSKGKSDAGLNRARIASRMRDADDELGKHPGISKGLRLSHDELRRRYENALLTNPDLTFGNFVAANRLGQNLGRRNPNITTNAILAGLANGRSIGQTLQDLGLSSRDAKDAEKEAKDRIKEWKKNKND